MALPNLEDLTADLDRKCADMLGETIQYKAVGEASFSEKKAHVDYRDALKAIEIAEVVAQNITVAALKADVSVKPTGACRIALSKLPGRTFKPINVRSDGAGTEWNFELADVSDG
ncbi:hypothetical protein [Novosphingobium sp. KN65.2]|uniref:hypothetical protein n=1 Tax=Novosphingobium sp. KN65.2 TaxID=1478134 RepID=UPI0005E0DB7A|nr:hypothetical protein [Novosphingobium sp. KN65.2]CDO34049.1 hypothetical protein SPHV1_100083 [Novosphingobium sp. KN65.2]